METLENLGYRLDVREPGFRIYTWPIVEPRIIMVSTKIGVMKMKFREDGQMVALMTKEELLATAEIMKDLEAGK